jgi:hypothetical protein
MIEITTREARIIESVRHATVILSRGGSVVTVTMSDGTPRTFEMYRQSDREEFSQWALEASSLVMEVTTRAITALCIAETLGEEMAAIIGEEMEARIGERYIASDAPEWMREDNAWLDPNRDAMISIVRTSVKRFQGRVTGNVDAYGVMRVSFPGADNATRFVSVNHLVNTMFEVPVTNPMEPCVLLVHVPSAYDELTSFE